MKRLAKYIRPYTGMILLTLAVKLLASLAELWIPSLMEVMLRRDTLTENVNLAYLYGGLMVLCAVACMVLNVLANRMSAQSSGQITRETALECADNPEQMQRSLK